MVSPDSGFGKVPFAEWQAEGPQEKIPWKVRIPPPELSFHQRLLARIEVQIPSLEITKRRGEDDLAVLVQISDKAGRVYQDHGEWKLKEAEPGTQKEDMALTWEALVLPGDYKVELALYDSVTLEHNYAERSLHAEPLKDGLLPDVWSGLPTVELFDPAERFDDIYRPEIRGRLHLPLVTQQPVRIELLLNLTPSEKLLDFPSAYRRNLQALLPALKSFSEIAVREGSLDVTALDLQRHTTSFHQENIGELDWPRLKEALKSADTNLTDVESLRHRKESAAYFRTEIARRMEASSSNSGTRAGNPLRVYILFSSQMSFDFGNSLSPAEADKKCNCRIYHVRYQLWPEDKMNVLHLERFMGTDDIVGILKPLKPRLFSVQTPEGFRKALAAILAELSRM